MRTQQKDVLNKMPGLKNKVKSPISDLIWQSNENKSLGTMIRFLRKSLEMTQSNLALQTNLTKSYISKIESDRQLPTIHQINKISKILNIDYFYLIMITIDIEEIESNDKKVLLQEIIENFNILNESYASPYKYNLKIKEQSNENSKGH